MPLEDDGRAPLVKFLTSSDSEVRDLLHQAAVKSNSSQKVTYWKEGDNVGDLHAAIRMSRSWQRPVVVIASVDGIKHSPDLSRIAANGVTIPGTR